jgi:hypothetical protein
MLNRWCGDIAAWALGEVPSQEAPAALAERLGVEVDEWVREEMELAVSRLRR